MVGHSALTEAWCFYRGRFIWVLVTALVVGGIAQIVVYQQQGVDITTTVLDLLNLVRAPAESPYAVE